MITSWWEKSKTRYVFLAQCEHEVLEEEHLLPHAETPYKWVKVMLNAGGGAAAKHELRVPRYWHGLNEL